MTNQTPSLPPGFRFHPTDEELILYYLRSQASSTPCPVSIIAEVDIYKFDPWNLPDKAMFGDREWYFFSPRDRKYPNGVRPNRAAASGYWKATGTDKPITTNLENESVIGVKKALVFYKGKPPKGIKTNWIMHEYRLCDSKNKSSYQPTRPKDSSMRLDDWVLCRIYKKNGHELLESQESDSQISNAECSTQDQNEGFKLHKSFSISEFLNVADFSQLSQLLEAPIDTAAEVPVSSKGSFDCGSHLNHSFNSVSNQKTEFNDSVFERNLKRQRTVDEENNLHASKKNINNLFGLTNFSNQFDSEAFLNQQLGVRSQSDMEQKWWC